MSDTTRSFGFGARVVPEGRDQPVHVQPIVSKPAPIPLLKESDVRTAETV